MQVSVVLLVLVLCAAVLVASARRDESAPTLFSKGRDLAASTRFEREIGRESDVFEVQGRQGRHGDRGGIMRNHPKHQNGGGVRVRELAGAIDPFTTLSVNDTNVLHMFYTSTGGSEWDYTTMQECLSKYGLLTGVNAFNFTTNAQGAYLENACDFMGVECVCSDSAPCLLTQLNLPCGNLRGPIVKEVGQFTALHYLDLSTNELTGSIPAGIGNLTALQYLYLSTNELTGSIPAEIGNLTALQTLNLSTNALTGNIPRQTGLLNSLTVLVLNTNYLNGTLPSSMTQLTKLEVLLVHNNNVTSDSDDAFHFISKNSSITALDISENGFSGTMPDDLFTTYLPRIETFAASSNCYRGSLPSSICSASNLKTLVLSGLSSGKTCRNNIWNETIFHGYFTGYTAKVYIEGTLPQCIFTLDSLVELYAGGNGILGELPQIISPKLQKISLPYNALNATLPPLLAAGKKLTLLDLSHNRLGGGLQQAFEEEGSIGAGDELDLRLRVNNLSGDIPESLQSFKNIDILIGNVFDCSYSKESLPGNDHSKDGYHCGSNLLNLSMYSFIFILVVALIILAKTMSDVKYSGELKLWMWAAEGKKEFNVGVGVTHIYNYYNHIYGVVRMSLKIGAMLVVVLIAYLAMSGSGYRLLLHSYTYVSSAVYLTGTGPTVVVTITSLIVVCSTLFLTYSVEARSTYASNHQCKKLDSMGSKEEAPSTTPNMKVLQPLLWLFCVVVISWGPMLAGNVWYANILLKTDTSTQTIFRYCFSAFKLVWTNVVSIHVFEMKWLRFGMDEKDEMQFLEKLCVSRMHLMFVLNSIALFFIPVMVQMVKDPACFYNFFEAESSDPIKFTYKGPRRCTLITPSGCFAYTTPTYHSSITANVPFVYNYTCSASILRAYVPVYAIIYSMLIVLSLVHFLYLCRCIHLESLAPLAKDRTSIRISTSTTDAGGAEADTGDPYGTMSIVEKYNLMGMPLCYLLADSNQRHAAYQPGRVFDTSSIFSSSSTFWMSDSIPIQLGAMLILLTYGMFVPLLALIIITSIIMQGAIAHLVVGKFLIREMSVMEQHLHVTKSKSHLPFPACIYVPAHILNEKKFQQQVKEAKEPWGAAAAIEHVNALCSEIPASVFPGSRDVYALSTAAVVAFVLNDIYNGQVGEQTHQWLVPVVALCVPLIFALLLRFYYRTTNEVKLSHAENKAAGGSCSANKEVRGDIAMVTVSKSKVVHKSDIANSKNPLHRPSSGSRVDGNISEV